MKTILSIITFLAFISASAQTPIIAHKSHAGSAVSFFIDPSSNFGEIYIPPTIYQEAITENFVHWELLDDSTIVKQVMDSNQRVISVDYISNKEKLSIDYFKYQFDMKQQRIRDSIYYDNYLKEQEKNEKKQNSIL